MRPVPQGTGGAKGGAIFSVKKLQYSNLKVSHILGPDDFVINETKKKYSDFLEVSHDPELVDLFPVQLV